MKVILMMVLLCLAACTHTSVVDYCRSIDQHSLNSPEDQTHAGSCGVTIRFDSPLGHKLEGEK